MAPPAVAVSGAMAASSPDSSSAIPNGATMPTPSPSPPPCLAVVDSTTTTTTGIQVHSLLRYLRASKPAPRFALVVVNRPLSHLPSDVLIDLWLHAEWRLCADGGANQLYDALAHDPELQRRLIPHIIAGDLDSARPEVLAFYRQLGAKVHKSSCQNSTDLQKCVAHLESIERHLAKEHDALVALPGTLPSSPKRLDLVVLGGTDGRFDQTMGVIHTLYTIAATSGRRVSLLDGHNFMSVLAPTTCPAATSSDASSSPTPAAHRIDLVHPLQGPHCGLLPVGVPTIVSTRGLVWDMDRFLLSFSTVISACNQVNRAHVATTPPDPWITRRGTPLRTHDVNVTFDDLERAMASSPPVTHEPSALGLTNTKDERVDLVLATKPRPTAAHAATAYALSACSPVPAASSVATSPPGASPPVSPTLLRKAAGPPPPPPPANRPNMLVRRGSSGLSLMDPVPPELRAGEHVSTVFVETSQPVVWTVEVDFSAYRSV